MLPKHPRVVIALLLLLLTLALPAFGAAPTVGTITASPATVGEYAKLELSFAVTTQATNLLLPYDPVPPSYQANLYPDEDATQGVSVEGLFLPPGQSDWSQALDAPGFYYQGYDHPDPEWFDYSWGWTLVRDAAQDGWRVRFAPNAVGTWQYKIRVTDAGGTVDSPVSTFTCTASSSHGFVRISPTDSRYFEFDDGTPAIWGGGENDQGNGTLIVKRINQAGDQGAVVPQRIWLACTNGLGVLGGGFNGANGGGRLWSINGNANGGSYLYADAHDGRYGLWLDSNPQAEAQAHVPVLPNTQYTISGWYKAVKITAATGQTPAFQIKTNWSEAHNYGGASATPVGQTVTNQAMDTGGGWVHFTATFNSHDPSGYPSFPNIAGQSYQPGAPFMVIVSLGCIGTNTGGHLMLSNIAVTDPQGVDTLGTGEFDSHVHYNQRQAWTLDQIVDTAQSRGQYLRLTCLDNAESAFGLMGPNAERLPYNTDTTENFYGATATRNADLATRRFQRYWARYVTARWGYATAVAQYEYCNEAVPDDPNGWAAAQDFCKAIHADMAQGRRPASTSNSESASGLFHQGDWMDKVLNPDLDYVDLHTTTNPLHGYEPLFDDTGWHTTLSTDGSWFWTLNRADGPTVDGLTRGSLIGTGNGSGTYAPLPFRGLTRLPNNSRPFIIQGQGTWTLKWQVKFGVDPRTQALTLASGVTSGPHLSTQITRFTDGAAISGSGTGTTPGTTFGWQPEQLTFTLPDAQVYNLQIFLHAEGFTDGQASFGDIQLLDPAGRVYKRYEFDEPLMDHNDSEVLVSAAQSYQSVSGDPALGEPLTLGETDVHVVNAQGKEVYSSDTATDAAGNYARQMAWASMNAGGVVGFWWLSGGDVSDRGLWKYSAGYERFMAGIPVSNGHYRALDATVSSKALMVIGQKDTTAGRAHFFVENAGAKPDNSDGGNWWNLAHNPSAIVPASGNITVSGLADGAYTLETWDTSLGQETATRTVTATAGVLSIPITGLVGDAAYQIAPATEPLLEVTLTADKTTVRPGDTVTYTLSYHNTGSADALTVTLPWAVPAQTDYVSASAGGTYDATRDEVDWQLGTVAAGQSGTVTLTVRVK